MQTLELNQKAWWQNQAKLDSRLTGIRRAQMVFGKKLPSHLQWWSMCGQCADEFGDWRGSEVHQLVASEFLSQNQFWGVELNPEIAAHNRMSIPQSYWRCGDICDVMQTASVKMTVGGRSAWRPGVINLDTTMFPAKASALLARTMLHVSETVPHEVLVILNMVVRHKTSVGTTADLVQALSENRAAQYATSIATWTTNWDPSDTPKYHSVDETGVARTVMQTHFFVKSAKD